MSYTFAPLLIKSPSPRLIFVTSGFSSLEVCTVSRSGVLAEMPPAGWPKPPVNTMIAYRAAKAGLNMLMLEWTRLLGADGGRVFCVSPGFVATGFAGMGGKEKMKEKGAKDASFAGSFIRDVVEGKRDGDSGKVVTSGGVQAW
jgi:NAD(P)-dependent dehydrogenase (short-subunit alcohol dehydrogenase family)